MSGRKKMIAALLSYGPDVFRKKILRFQKMVTIFVGILLLAFAFNLPAPDLALAASDTLEITGEGVANPMILTRAQLEIMDQEQYVYSTINTWPTKNLYIGRGVKLNHLLGPDQAGMKPEATLVKFTSIDGYAVLLTVKELFKDKRYYFPNFKVSGGSDSDGHLPGDPSGKVEVEPIIALSSAEGSANPKYMNDLHTFLLMLGQRTVTEQTGNLFAKYIHKIEVLTKEPEKWDEPQANPPGGTVPAGTMVALGNLNTDDDKIHYTMDGSTPTFYSPMYNSIASRWWSARADVLGSINHPLGPIEKNTVIKAVTIGPGKLDSDVVTFHYYVEGEDGYPAAAGIVLTVDRKEASVEGETYILEAAPYLDSKAGRTMVPVRFISEALGAGVAWDPETRQVIISDEGKEIKLTIGSKEVQINGRSQSIDCAATILFGRTFVPLRFIVEEALGAEVDYEPATKEITITR